MSQQYGSWFPPEWVIGEENGRRCNVFDIASEDICHHYCSILLITQTGPDSVEGVTQGHSYQEESSLGTILEAGYHSMGPGKPGL